jgi:NAD(P)-dependent dehydrogenase (short-subunit alcohol dehydrogenase family)
MGTSFRDVKGKVAIITGGARGIGQSCATAMAKEGVHVVISDILSDVFKTWDEIKKNNPDNQGYAVQTDVSKEAEVKRLIEGVVAKFGRLDIMCNNAGVNGGFKLIEDVTQEDIDWHFKVNFNGVLFGCKYAAIQMKKQRFGTIVNTGSFYGKVGHAGSGVYGASKNAIHTLTQALALEMAPYGVTANAVCPALADSEMHWKDLRKLAKAEGITPQEALERELPGIPLHRLGTGADSAGAILWLASKSGSYVTGQLINVNGGLDFS